MRRGEDGVYEVPKDQGDIGGQVTADDLMEPSELTEWIRRNG